MITNSNKYRVLKQNVFVDNLFSIEPIRWEDRYMIMSWRNKQLNILRQAGVLTKKDQDEYFAKELIPNFYLKRPTQIVFGFKKNQSLIGYGGLTNINWHNLEAEISFLVKPELAKSSAKYKEAFNAFIRLVKRAAFVELKLNRLFTETYAFRKQHIKILESNNFNLEGRMKHKILFKGKYIDSLIHSMLRKKYEN